MDVCTSVHAHTYIYFLGLFTEKGWGQQHLNNNEAPSARS